MNLSENRFFVRIRCNRPAYFFQEEVNEANTDLEIDS